MDQSDLGRAALTAAVVSLLCLGGCGEDRTAPPSNQGGSTIGSTQPGGNTYLGLRDMALGFRMPPESKALVTGGDGMAGLVVDWGISERETVTIVCLNEGSVSMYLSSGGGVIGAGEHQSVRDASLAALTEALRSRQLFAGVARVEFPPSGVMRFTLIDGSGLSSVDASVDDLAAGRGPLAKLGNAVQAVITEIRRMAG